MSGDSIDARDSQGLVNNPQAEIRQDFGNKQTTHTSGGDAAGGDLDKRTQITNNFFLFSGAPGAPDIQQSLQPLSQLLEQINDLDLIRQSYRDALPVDAALSRPDATTIAEMVTQLQEFRRLPDFIQRLAADHNTPQQLRGKLHELKQSLATGEPQNPGIAPAGGVQPILQSYLQIVLCRDNSSDRVRVSAWLIPDNTVDDPAKRCQPLDLDQQQKGASCAIADVPQVVDQFLKLSLDTLYGKRHVLTIEVFLPLEHLCANVDSWVLTDDLGFITEPFVLGTKYRVIVRSQERLNPKYLRSQLTQWHTNWDRVQACLHTAPNEDDFEHLSQFECCNWKQLVNRLTQKLGLKLTCGLVDAHKKDLFTAILRAAAPIAVWTRCKLPDLDAVAEMNQLLLAGPLLELSEAVRKMRERADIADVPTDHLGCHLAMLWEDPNRLTPDVMAQLIQLGQ